MDRASADTDDLDTFVDHGGNLNRRLTDVYETLARQRNHLLSAGFPRVVTDSEISTLDNTLIFMADLDRFVADISAALKTGIDLGDGVFAAPAVRLDSRLDRTDDQRLEELQAALEAEGLSEEEAARIRDAVEARLGHDPRFEIAGAAVSEPDDLAAAILADIETRAAELIETNQVTSSALHARPRRSTDQLAADLYFDGPADPLIPPDLLLDELGALLDDDQYADLRTEIEELDRRARLANRSLVAGGPDGGTFDVELGDLDADARRLYDGNKVGLPYGGDGHRLDEPEIAYQLQLIAEHDPGRALGIKWLLDGMMAPDERAELDRVLATGGTFSERVDLATSHPGDGVIGAAKGSWNDNFGWLADGWADAEVAIANGLYGMALGSAPHSLEVAGALPRVPTSWDENEKIIELEFTMDNLAQQGGADLAFAIEIASAAYGGGKGGLSLVRIGRKFFLRSGDDILTEVGPTLARQLDEGKTSPLRPQAEADRQWREAAVGGQRLDSDVLRTALPEGALEPSHPPGRGRLSGDRMPTEDVPNPFENAAENRAADGYRNRGYEALQMPEDPTETRRLRQELGLPDPPNPSKNPDLLVEGEYVDVYTPKRLRSSLTPDQRADRILSGALEQKLRAGQTERVLIVLDRADVSAEDMAEAVDRLAASDGDWLRTYAPRVDGEVVGSIREITVDLDGTRVVLHP